MDVKIEVDKIRGGSFTPTVYHEVCENIKNKYKISDEDWIIMLDAIFNILNKSRI